MKIYTYHENINFKKQSELIELWKMSWAGLGFKPIVLDISSAASHPYYNEFVEKLKDIHLKIMQMPIKPYGLSCYVRWLAYANQPDEKFYVSHYCVSKIIKNQNYQNTNIDDLRVLLTKKLLRL